MTFPPPRWCSARRRAGLVLALLVPAVTTAGCYTSRPTTGLPPAGAFAVLTLNDRGRVALADTLGTPDVDRVEGRVAERSDSAVVLSLTRVRTFRGNETPWAGERVTFRASGVREVSQRVPSRGRTVALVATALGALVALALTVGLGGGGVGTNQPSPGTPPPSGS